MSANAELNIIKVKIVLEITFLFKLQHFKSIVLSKFYDVLFYDKRNMYIIIRENKYREESYN